MAAACLASALLGSIMIFIVMVSRPLKINPDNVATPIAASLGDLVTLSLLSGIAYGLYKVKGERVWWSLSNPFVDKEFYGKNLIHTCQ